MKNNYYLRGLSINTILKVIPREVIRAAAGKEFAREQGT